MKRIGIVGTGFIASGTYRLLQRHYQITKVLTRRCFDEVSCIPKELLTCEIDELIEASDLIFEASGDAIHGTEVVERSLKAALPVVTLNPELHVTSGSYLSTLGYLTEAEGDQPGCFAALKREAEAMSFTPLAYVNIKGFYSPNPAKKEMQYWADKQNIRIEQVTAFTDGSKLQIEQALTANGLGATIAKEGLIGGDVDDLKHTDHFARKARRLAMPIADYIVCPRAPKGVSLLAESDLADRYREYPFSSLLTELGEAFILTKPYHMCHLEALKTVKEAFAGAPPLLNNGLAPHVGVSAIAKRRIEKGAHLKRALGGFDVRGETVFIKDHPNHVPICLLQDARFLRDIEPGEMISFADVELPESRALEIHQSYKGSTPAEAFALSTDKKSTIEKEKV